MACLFLDLSFDDVIPKILTEDLEDIGLPPILCQFIYNLIHLKKIQFSINRELSGEIHSFKKGYHKDGFQAPSFKIFIHI